MENPAVPINISIPSDLAQHLRDSADREDRTISAEVRRSLEAYFDWDEREGSTEKAVA